MANLLNKLQCHISNTKMSTWNDEVNYYKNVDYCSWIMKTFWILYKSEVKIFVCNNFAQ